MVSKLGGSFGHRGYHGIQFFLFDAELLEVVDYFIFAFGGDLVDMEAEVLEKFMDVHVPFQNKYRPPVGTRMPTHQPLQGLQVDEPHVVHPSVNLTDVNAEYSQLVPVQRVLQEPQVHLHFELCLQNYAQQGQVFTALPRVIVRDLFGRGYDLIYRQVLKNSTESGNPARNEVPPLVFVFLFVSVQFRESVHNVVGVVIVVDHF